MSAAFLDGPAKGITILGLERLPVFLRVVRVEPNGMWDALDQLDDTPRDSETIDVYQRKSFVYACQRGAGKRTDPRHATYTAVPLELVDAAAVRDTDRWREWCERTGDLLGLAA